MLSFALFLLLFIKTNAQFSVDGILSISLASTTIQQVTDYTFDITLAFNDPLTVGSVIQINFPSNYESTSTVTYPCEIVSWPFVGATISCTMTNRILKVEGGFPQEHEIIEDTQFQFLVRDLQNPNYAGTTGEFDGSFKNVNGTQIVAIETQTLIITTGTLTIDMEVSPAVVNSESQLIVTVNPSHEIPQNGWLRIRIESNVWAQSASISPSEIFESSPNCNFLNNTPTNLYCTFTSLSQARIISVYNIVSSASQQQFSFTISSIKSPPTTQPQGQFSFITKTSSNEEIDESENNKVYGLSAATILSPGISMETYVNSQIGKATITIKITSIIQTSDVVYIDIPSSIGLGELSLITVGSTQIITFQIINSTIVAFSGIEVYNALQFTIILTNLLNPTYVLTTANFSIWTKRNNYEIDRVDNAFSYTTIAGDLNATLTPDNYQAGFQTTYTFIIEVQHTLSSTSKIQISFPSDSFSISTSNSITCNSNLSASCSLTITSDNIVLLQNIITSTATAIRLSLSLIKNPGNVGDFTSVSIVSKTGTDGVVDSEQSGVSFAVEARELSASDISITSTSQIVYKTANITLNIGTKNPIESGSTMLVTIPTQLILSGLFCSPSCQDTGNNVYQISLTESSTNTTIELILINIKNPLSTRPTNSFQIQIYNNGDELVQFLRNGLPYTATEPASLGITVDRNSTKNYQRFTVYTFNLAVSFSITDSVGVEVAFPVGIQCSGCIVSDQNSTHYTVLEEPLTFSSKTLTFQIEKLTNYLSYEPQTIQVRVLDSSLIYEHAAGSIVVTNQQASDLTYTHEFSVRQYDQETTLIVSDITAATKTSLQTLQIIFGPEFDLSLASFVANPDYSAVISASRITLTLQSTGLTSFSIQKIVCPSTSPSTDIYFQSFSDASYLMGEASQIQWSTLCTDPCKTCSSSDLTLCQSCYSNELLVQSQTLFHNQSCVSVCPGTYFHNQSTNSCLLCSSDCENCVNYSVCTSCPNSLPYLLNNTCYSQCPLGYFEATSTCEVCDPDRHCLECSDFISCDSCENNYYFYLSQCYASCPENITVQNQYTWNCDSCPQNCTKCTGDGCTQCENGFLLDDFGCYSSCQTVGFVPFNQICRQCDLTCFTCSENIYHCLNCYSNSTFKYYLENRCLEACPDGYYEDTSLLLCLPCTQPCQYCSSSSVSSCQSCIDGFSLYGNVCQSSCPQTFYQNGSECKSCVSPCLTCSSEQVCMTCQAGFSFFSGTCISSCADGYVSINQICLECSSNCKTCSLVNFCTSCFDSTYLYEGTCISPCPDTYFQNQTALTCDQCPFECSDCQDYSVCLNCIGGYELSPNNTCESTCDNGYVPIDSICEACDENCTKCIYIVSNCTQCIPTFYLDESGGKCYQSCPDSMVTYVSECLSACPSATYEDSKVCYNCPAFCSSCISSTTCSACLSGASMYNSLCYENCPSEAPYSIDDVCQTCDIVACYECSGEQCQQCDSGFLLIGSSLCIDSCGDQSAYNPTKKQCETIDNNNNQDNNSTNTTTTEEDLDFIPLPYTIITTLGTIIVVVVHFTHKVLLLPILSAVSSTALFLSAVTVIVVQIILFKIGIPTYIILACLGIGILFNVIIMFMFCCNFSQKRWFPPIACLLGFKNYGFLLANIKKVNLRSKNEDFWQIYDRFILAYVIVNLGFIAGGVMLAFQYKKTQFPFYGGIQIIILALFDFLTGVFWLLWDHEDKEFNLEKIYQPEDSFQNLDKNQISANIAQTQIINPNKYQSQREYHSENPQGKDVVKLKNSQIEEAIDRGIYRRNKFSLAKEQQQEDELSQLESADKFNKAQYELQKQGSGESPNKKKKVQIEDIEEKQIEEGGIIFEDLEESIDTKLDEEIVIKRKKSNDSLGSEQDEKKTKVVNITPTKELVIEDLLVENEKVQTKQQGEKNYINIFEMEDEERFRKRKTKKSSKEDKPEIEEFNQIIYADLESVGTVEEVEDEDKSEWSDIQLKKRDMGENIEEMQRPSRFMKTTFKYKKEQPKKRGKN